MKDRDDAEPVGSPRKDDQNSSRAAKWIIRVIAVMCFSAGGYMVGDWVWMFRGTTAPPFSELTMRSGVLYKSAPGRYTYLCVGSPGSQMSVCCYVGQCGFVGWPSKLGQPASAWEVGRRVFQISVDGHTVLEYSQLVRRIQDRRDFGFVLLGISFVCVAYMLVKRRSQKGGR